MVLYYRNNQLRDLRDAKAQYNYIILFHLEMVCSPLEAKLAARAYNLTGDPFNSLEYNIEEILLDLEIRKADLSNLQPVSRNVSRLNFGFKVNEI